MVNTSVSGSSGRFGDVFNPATGEVQARVPLASKEELDAAVEIAAKVQPEWGAVNPQRRARVMMKFVDLLHRDMDKLAEAIYLQADLLTLKANPKRPARGVVLESKLEKGRGSVATILVQKVFRLSSVLLFCVGHPTAKFTNNITKINNAPTSQTRIPYISILL